MESVSVVVQVFSGFLQQKGTQGVLETEVDGMTKTPDEIKKGMEICNMASGYKDCKKCPYFEILDCGTELKFDALALIQKLQAENAEKDQKIREHEVERDELKEALGLMVYQYCVRGDKLDHLYMCAGETAFRVLGLEQYGNTSSLESWLFPEFQDKEE